MWGSDNGIGATQRGFKGQAEYIRANEIYKNEMQMQEVRDRHRLECDWGFLYDSESSEAGFPLQIHAKQKRYFKKCDKPQLQMGCFSTSEWCYAILAGFSPLVKARTECPVFRTLVFSFALHMPWHGTKMWKSCPCLNFVKYHCLELSENHLGVNLFFFFLVFFCSHFQIGR